MRSFAIQLLCLSCATAGAGLSESPDFTWARGGGGTGADSLFGLSVSSNGYALSVGQFKDTAQFGTNTLIAGSPGYSDVFVTRHDWSGNVIWARAAGGTNEDYASAVAVNDVGDVLVTGAFRDAATFGGMSILSSGIEDMFLAKYNSAGDILWLRSGGGNGHDFSTAIAARGTNGCYVTGAFQSTASFQGTNLNSLGVYDVFLARYEAGGNLLWIRSAGGTADDRSLGIAVDEAGDVIISGYFASATANFNGIILTNQSPPFSEGFLVKYDAAGNVAWARIISGADSERGVAVAAGNSGEVIVTGRFSSATVTFGGNTLTNHGGSDLFLARYGSAGNLIWARNDGGAGDDLPGAIALDSAGNSYVAGSFAAIAEFGTVSLTNNGTPGTQDAFAAKYDHLGNVLWAVRIGGNTDDSASGIGVDLAGRTYLGGTFESASLVFNGSTLTNRGEGDVFFAQIGIVEPTLALTRSVNGVIISWPAWHTGFSLQTSSVTGAGVHWNSINGVPGIVGDQFRFTNSPLTSNGFYRLYHP